MGCFHSRGVDSRGVESRGVDSHIVPKSRSVVTTRIPENVKWSDTVPFVPPITSGRVIKVYDGDTITIAAKLPRGLKLYRFQVRLLGIDTPELRTSDDGEKAVAVKAKEGLKSLVLGEMVSLRNTDNDKYGRLLADVYFGDIHVNNWMLQQRYAVPYGGGRKRAPADWEVFHHGSGSVGDRVVVL